MDLRSTMLRNAVDTVRAENGALDVASVAKHLPADFDLRADDGELDSGHRCNKSGVAEAMTPTKR